MNLDTKCCFAGKCFTVILIFFRQLSHGANTFLGLERNRPEQQDVWLQRRAALFGRNVFMGRAVSKKCRDKLECAEDRYASMRTPTPRDPLHRPGQYLVSKNVFAIHRKAVSSFS